MLGRVDQHALASCTGGAACPGARLAASPPCCTPGCSPPRPVLCGSLTWRRAAAGARRHPCRLPGVWVGVCPCACDGGAPARGRCRGIARRARGAAAAGAGGSKGGGALRSSASALLLNHHIHRACRESAGACEYGRRQAAAAAGGSGRNCRAPAARGILPVAACRSLLLPGSEGAAHAGSWAAARGLSVHGSGRTTLNLQQEAMSTLPTKPWRACGPGLGR